MLEIRRVTTFDEPDLGPYRTMRRHHEHRVKRIFVAEGVKVVTRLLESDLEVVSVLLPDEWFEHFRPMLEKRPEPVIRVWLAEKKLVEQLTGFSMFQGVLAVGRIPPEPVLEELVDRSPQPRLFVALDGLTNAENVGAILRCCGAFRVHGVLSGENSSSPYLRRAVRSSMGAVFEIPVIESESLVRDLQRLRAKGVRIIAAHPRKEAKKISEADFRRDICLVLGSEGYGITEPVLEVCDEWVAIPMPEGFDSLNVSHAGVVFLYEIARQRGLM